MKSFRDRNPYAIGIVSVVIIGAMVGFAFAVGLLRIGEKAYDMKGVFSDASGIRAGDDVRVAGVKAGRVTKVVADRDAGNVIVEWKVNRGVDLGPETSAEVALQTLLGTKFLRLSGPVVRPYMADLPPAERVIPIDRTKTPFDVFELTKVGTRAIQETDTEKLNALVRQLADVTEGKQLEIRQLLDGVDTLATALNERDAQLRTLLDEADTLSGTLAEKDETLVALIEQSRGVLDLIARRRGDISAGIDAGALTVEQLALLLSANKSEVDLILDGLHPTVDILERRSSDLDRALAVVGPGAHGLNQATTHGPWADIYVRSVGPDLVCIIAQARGVTTVCQQG